MLFALVPGRRKIPPARTKETEEKEHKTTTAPTLINHLFIFAFLLIFLWLTNVNAYLISHKHGILTSCESFLSTSLLSDCSNNSEITQQKSPFLTFERMGHIPMYYITSAAQPPFKACGFASYSFEQYALLRL